MNRQETSKSSLREVHVGHVGVYCRLWLRTLVCTVFTANGAMRGFIHQRLAQELEREASTKNEATVLFGLGVLLERFA